MSKNIEKIISKILVIDDNIWYLFGITDTMRDITYKIEFSSLIEITDKIKI